MVRVIKNKSRLRRLCEQTIIHNKSQVSNDVSVGEKE